MGDSVKAADKIEAFGISEDGRSIRMNFSVPDDDQAKVVITMPVENVLSFWQALNDMIFNLRKAGALPAESPLYKVMSFAAGEAKEVPKHTILLFNQSMPVEFRAMVPDNVALQIADKIEKMALAHMSMENRLKLGALKPQKRPPGLILP